jgi:hypothetical protein
MVLGTPRFEPGSPTCDRTATAESVGYPLSLFYSLPPRLCAEVPYNRDDKANNVKMLI